MAPAIVAIIVVTFFFAALGALYAGKNSGDRGLVRTMVITTCLCLWVFWLAAFMSQINPLVAPEFKTEEACLTAGDGTIHC